MIGNCWGTWLIMLGFMDLGWPRVCRRSTSVLLSYTTGLDWFDDFTDIPEGLTWFRIKTASVGDVCVSVTTRPHPVELLSMPALPAFLPSPVAIIIKSPRYTGGDFMFLYRLVRHRRCRPQILVHAITFEQLFGFLSFLARLLALTCRLPD